MYTFAPDNYTCPLCLTIAGIESDETFMKQADIFYRDEVVLAAVNSKFVGNNPGHPIIFPIHHHENLFTLPEDVAAHIMKVSQQVAVGLMQVRQCQGVMIEQNNGPASGQHAFHYHMHLFPRFTDDSFEETMNTVRLSDPAERLPYAKALQAYFRYSAKTD